MMDLQLIFFVFVLFITGGGRLCEADSVKDQSSAVCCHRKTIKG